MVKRVLYSKIARKVFLEGVKERLENDVLPYIDCIKQAEEQDERGRGYWALARLIFPPINAVAVVLYKSKESKEKKETDKFTRLLKKLGIKYPLIVLEMYRHPLIHRDKPRGIWYRGHKILWSITNNGAGHIFYRDAILLDGKTLYNNFIEFLNKEIQASGTKQVWIENEIQFGRKTPSQLKREFKTITQR